MPIVEVFPPSQSPGLLGVRCVSGGWVTGGVAFIRGSSTGVLPSPDPPSSAPRSALVGCLGMAQSCLSEVFFPLLSWGGWGSLRLLASARRPLFSRVPRLRWGEAARTDLVSLASRM